MSKLLCGVLVLLVASGSASAQTPVTTALTYQGELANGGTPVNGTYDLVFSLYNDTAVAAGPICVDHVSVVNGRFTVQLDFGLVYTGQRRYLEISVRADSTVGNCATPGGYTTLSPRQELTLTPYSASALSAVNSVLLNNQPAAFYLNAANLTGTLADGRLSSNVPRLGSGQMFAGANVFSNAGNVFSGSGAGLTNLSATNVTSGTLTDSRLSSNVALLSGTQTFVGVNTFSSASNTFTGSGAGLTDLNAASVTTGTLADGRLSAGIPRLVANQTFSGANTFSNSANTFAGAGTLLTSLNASNLGSGTVPDGRISSSFPRLVANQTFTGSNTFSNASNSYTGSGAGLTSLNASNLSSGLVPAARLPAGLLQAGNAATITADWLFSGTVGVVTAPTANEQVRVDTTRITGIKATTSNTTTGSAAVEGSATGATGIAYGGKFSSSGAGSAVRADTTADNVSTIFAFNTGDNGSALRASTLGTSSNGVHGVAAGDLSRGVYGESQTTTGTGYGVYGVANSVGTAVHGVNLGATGNAHGVVGVAFSPSGYGVLAQNNASNGTALLAQNTNTTGTGRGVVAMVNSPDAVGVDVNATSLTGTTIGVRSSVNSPSGWAGYFNGRVRTTDKLSVNTPTPTAMVHATAPAGTDMLHLQNSTVGADVLVDSAGQLAVGTTSPSARLHANAAAGEAPFRASIDDLTKLVVRSNGGVTVGGVSELPPTDGLLVDTGIVVRSAGASLWLGPNAANTAGRLIINNSPGDYYLWFREQGGSSKMTVDSTGGLSVGSSSVPPAGGLIVNGNAVIGTVFPLPPERLYVSGNAEVSGSLAKGGGSFKIDHPLDPENKFLYHSFVESPDMMNVYNGNITTDEAGLATVTLPNWFEALNRDFRYQLTVIDSGDVDFALARVFRKIEGNQFVLKTNLPNVEVSWQVTGIRKDRWAEKHRIPVEQDKPAAARGRYQHPEAWGKRPEDGIHRPMAEPEH